MVSRKAQTLRATYIKNSWEMGEYIKCKKDVFYFINTYVKLSHPTQGEIPFNLYGFQYSLLMVYLRYRFSVCLKPRQMGISTLVAAYILWTALFHAHQNILVISIKQSAARALLRRIKFMYVKLPSYLKVELTNGGADQIGTADRISFANNSEINVSASTPDAGRSDSLSLLVMDEVAFQRYASKTWGAGQQTLATGGRAILLSTAFGIGNFFHTTYTEALQNLNGFFPVRLKWQMHPDRNEYWYKEQAQLLGKKRLAQEIDCNFLQSGFTVFDMAKVRAIEDRIKERPAKELRMSDRLQIFHTPESDMEYWIGADIASGKARDFSAFSVMDRNGKECACFKGKMGVRDFAYLLMSVGDEYNSAWLAPENNAIGHGTLATIQENSYPNIYTQVSRILNLEDYSAGGLAKPEESLAYGWFTTGKTRHEMITNLDDDLNDELVELNNPFFVQEAYTFVYNENNKPIALGKNGGGGSGMYDDEEETSVVYTDDSIIAACITNSVRSEPKLFRGPMPIVGGSLLT